MTSSPDPRLLAVLADLTAEGDALEALVADLPEDGWRLPTPAEGWDVATSVAHLAWTDEVAVLAAGARTPEGKEAWDAVVLQAIEDPAGFVDEAALTGGAVPSARLLARWRSARVALVEALTDHPGDERLPWFGPPMSPTSMATARFMETWAHALDVAEALGVTVAPHDRVRHVVHLGVRTRGFSFVNNGQEVPPIEPRVALTAPSGELWESGPADSPESVTGSAWDFALLVTQRRHRADLDVHATGPGADAWLDLAQAFAGPTGHGREASAASARSSSSDPSSPRSSSSDPSSSRSSSSEPSSPRSSTSSPRSSSSERGTSERVETPGGAQ